MSRERGEFEGKRIGGYRLEKRIGKGGMAEVYAARSKKGRPVAVKILSRALARHESGLERFHREADAVQRLDHPNVVTVLDHGDWKGTHYLVMEQLRGGAFRRLLEAGARPELITSCLADVAGALAHAHAAGIVHRDVKPDNVLLTRRGKAKIADFGLARATDASTFTTDGALLGTARYMSPEQARGLRAGPPSDVYSFGVVLYEAVSGELPFSSDTQHGFLFQHVEESPSKPRRRQGFAPGLARLAMRCLDKRPEDRPSMAEVEKALDDARDWRPRKRLRKLALAAAAAVVATAAIAVAFPEILAPLSDGWFGAPLFRRIGELAAAIRAALP